MPTTHQIRFPSESESLRTTWCVCPGNWRVRAAPVFPRSRVRGFGRREPRQRTLVARHPVGFDQPDGGRSGQRCQKPTSRSSAGVEKRRHPSSKVLVLTGITSQKGMVDDKYVDPAGLPWETWPVRFSPQQAGTSRWEMGAERDGPSSRTRLPHTTPPFGYSALRSPRPDQSPRSAPRPLGGDTRQ